MADIPLKTCSQCGEVDSIEHNPMTIQYQCFMCNHYFSDEWCCAVDGTCPFCDAGDNSPISWEEHNPRTLNLDLLPPLLTLYSDCMKSIMAEHKATITGRFTSRTPSFHEMYGGRRADIVIMDDLSDIRKDIWLPVTPKDPRPQPDWEHPIPKRGPETPPNDAKRQQLRAKRKRKK